MDLSRIAARVAQVAASAGTGGMIVIDCNANTAVRAPDVRAAVRAAVLAQIADFGAVHETPDGDEVDESNVDEFLDSFNGDFGDGVGEVLVVGPEDQGPEGVAIGFSSSDRASFAMPWPPEEGAWLGNGDVYVFDMRGVPEGTVVKGVETQAPESP